MRHRLHWVYWKRERIRPVAIEAESIPPTSGLGELRYQAVEEAKQSWSIEISTLRVDVLRMDDQVSKEEFRGVEKSGPFDRFL